MKGSNLSPCAALVPAFCAASRRLLCRDGFLVVLRRRADPDFMPCASAIDGGSPAMPASLSARPS